MIINVQVLLDKKSDEIITIGPDNTVQEAIEIMAEKTISALPVMKDDKVIGIISERDYIRKLAPARKIPWEVLVSEIMTENVISVTRSEVIPVCMTIMSKNRIRHLPVIEDEKLVGILSVTDVVQALRSIV